MSNSVLAKMFGIDRYDAEIEVLEERNDTLVDRVAYWQNLAARLQKELDLYKAQDEEKVQIIREDIREIEELYEKRIKECEEMMDACDRKIHRYYSNGRMDAYREMGIKVIEAHERGNDIVYDIENDAFIEEIDEEKLNDIWDELENEITIYDLV